MTQLIYLLGRHENWSFVLFTETSVSIKVPAIWILQAQTLIDTAFLGAHRSVFVLADVSLHPDVSFHPEDYLL